MHALLEPGIAGARGIEIDRIKCDKAAAFLKQVSPLIGVALIGWLAGWECSCSRQPVVSLAPCGLACRACVKGN